jgi:uncharacterized membrane protein
MINKSEYFLYAILLISLILPVTAWITNLRGKVIKGEFDNPAIFRKNKARARSFRRWSGLVIAGYVCATLSLTVLKAASEREVVLSPAEPMQIFSDTIMIPIDNVNDGHLHRFAYQASDGTAMRFIVIKKNESAYGVGLDACDICGATGYYERENDVICKLCDVVMNKSTIGFKGGCNPVPLDFTLKGGNMVIQTENLEKEKSRFK